MKLEPPVNSNYAARVVSIKNIIELENCDNVVQVNFDGYKAIIGKDHKVGELGVYFSAETQLSEEFASQNNLFRDENLNKVKTAKGYLENNRRVKALKFRGHESSALWLPIESLSYIKGYKELQEGDTFDKLNGHDICKKYTLPVKGQPSVAAPKAAKFDEKLFPQHRDTDQYGRNCDKIEPDRFITVSQKLHGTSIRIGHVPITRELNWLERFLVRFGIKIETEEYAYVVGSRRVIKSIVRS